MATLPEIDGGACVHALSPNASCRACVDACPPGAWLLDDEGLALDTAACDGCALCVPACPRDAIGLPRTLTILHDGHGHGTTFAACERAPATSAPVMPCIHAIGVRDLDALANQDVTRLLVLTGTCQSCARGKGPVLADAGAKHRQLRSSRGLPAITIEMVADARGFARSYARALEDHERVDRSKRRLFGAFLAEKAGHEEAKAAAALAYHAPVIDPARCVACDACVRICPDTALTKQASPPAYVSEPAACTGCGLCVDVCDQAAIAVRPMSPSAKSAVALDLCRCRMCGAQYHAVADKASQGAELCRICARTPHNKMLFQVFKD